MRTTSRASVFACGVLCALGCRAAPFGADGGADASGPDAALDTGVLDGGPDAAAPTRRVLFAGNSYTQFNDLPNVIAQIGDASGTPLEVEMITVGGATLYDHWTSTGARERIERGGLDAVVLQGQSQEAGGPGWLASAALFAEILTETQTVWFATWPRHGDAFFDPELGPAVANAWIERGYRDAAAINGDVVARVGGAWEIARRELPDVRLHQADLSHPRPEGSLIAACVIHRALTGRASVLPDPVPYGLERDLATRLCALASRVACPYEHMECDAECVEVANDPERCGGCGVVCEGGDPCRNGVCGCGDLPGYTGCERSRCAALDRDEDDCGACGVTCGGGARCDEGTCACPDARAYDVLGAPLPECAGASELFGAARLACNAAGHEYCAALECFESGYAPPSGHAPVVGSVVCLRGEARTTTLAALAAHEPSCMESLTPACVTAIHRYCIAEGFASGFGPVGESGEAIAVTCLPGATVLSAPEPELSGSASRCTPDPITCGVAAWNYCAREGHTGGYGPVEPDTVVWF